MTTSSADAGSGRSLLPVAEARAAILDQLQPIAGWERVAVRGALGRVLADLARCAPDAVATTKRLVLAAAAATSDELGPLLDAAAEDFARAARGPESLEGMTAFIQKRRPNWADE